MAYLHDHTYSLPWSDWIDKKIKTEEVDIDFSNGMILELHEESLDIEKSTVLTSVKSEPISEDEGFAENTLRDRCGQEKVGDANAADSSIQRSKSDHNPRDLLSATDDKLGSSKRKLSPADRESVENSCKKSKPTRKFCSICGDSFYSKNMARHSKSKTHIYNEKKGAGSKPYPSKAKIIIVPASVLSTYISSDNLEPFKQALLREGYMFEH